MANQHAKVAAAAIIQLLKGEAVSQTPVVMNTCYSFVSAKDVIHVASVHQYNAEQKQWALKQMSPPISQTVLKVSRETGITPVTLRTWRNAAIAALNSTWP